MLKQGREAILFLFLFKFCRLFLNSQKVGFKSHYKTDTCKKMCIEVESRLVS